MTSDIYRKIYIKSLLMMILLVSNLCLASSVTLRVNYSQKIKTANPSLAGANVNAVGRMLDKGDNFDEAVRALGIMFMRFQGPVLPGPDDGKWDYKNYQNWNDDDFKILDKAVRKAYENWGVEELMLCMHTIKKPIDDTGKLIEADFEAYSNAVAKVADRYSHGKLFVKYWEPFNEWEHPGRIKKYKEHGQDFKTVLKLFNLCSKKIKEINPDFCVGGPAAVDSSISTADEFISKSGDYSDFISWHDYITGKATTPDDVVLRGIEERYVGNAQQISELVKLSNKDMKLIMTEYHINYHSWDPPETRCANQFGAVFAGSILANFAKSLPVYSVMVHDVQSRFYGLVEYASKDKISQGLNIITDKKDENSIHVRPIGWVYHWFNLLYGGYIVESEIEDIDSVTSKEETILLDSCAWKNNKLNVVMLVNKSDNIIELTVVSGAEIPDESFELPITVRQISENSPVIYERQGSKDSGINLELPPMSVSFVSYESERY